MKKLFYLICLFLLTQNLVARDLQRRKLSPLFAPKDPTRIKLAGFDADSTVRVAPSGNVSANSGRDVWILPLVSQEIARLNEEGYLVALFSNQGGVPKMVSLEDADEALDFVRKMLVWLNPKAVIHYYDFAENRDHDRKPETGMFERAEGIVQKLYGPQAKFDREHSFMCGDSAYTSKQIRPDGKPGTDFSSSDREVAANFNIPFIDPADLFHWRKYGYERFENKQAVDDFFKKNPQLKIVMGERCPFPSLLKKGME